MFRFTILCHWVGRGTNRVKDVDSPLPKLVTPHPESGGGGWGSTESAAGGVR
jgi:hypothetical protein